jgi:hypothetical protein
VDLKSLAVSMALTSVQVASQENSIYLELVTVAVDETFLGTVAGQSNLDDAAGVVCQWKLPQTKAAFWTFASCLLFDGSISPE